MIEGEDSFSRFFPSINSFRIGSEKSVKLLAAKSVEILGETILETFLDAKIFPEMLE